MRTSQPDVANAYDINRHQGGLAVFLRIAMTGLITLGLFGCAPEHPNIYMPVGHPANPATASGKALGAPAALRPEITRAEPEAIDAAAQAPNPLSTTDRRNRPGATKQ